MTRNEKEIILRSVITAFTTKEMMFTSVEIANHLKRLGVWMRNRHVAEYLRDNLVDISAEFGVDYTCRIIVVDSGGRNMNATLYLPQFKDAGDYLARDLRAITPDEFEAMHGVSPFEKDETSEKKDAPVMDVKGTDIVFKFPDPK